MKDSAALSNAASKTAPSAVACLSLKDRNFDPPPIRYAWTEELERRRRAVARWRGNDYGLKETMMRG